MFLYRSQADGTSRQLFAARVFYRELTARRRSLAPVR